MINDFFCSFSLARMHRCDIDMIPQNWPKRNTHVITCNTAFFLLLRTENVLEIWLQESVNND